MDIPAEAINAIRLLWGYYLAHVVLLVILLWPAYAFVKLKHAIPWSVILLCMVMVVEIFQFIVPELGDADLNDLFIGWGTIFIFSLMFIPIRMRMTIAWGKD